MILNLRLGSFFVVVVVCLMGFFFCFVDCLISKQEVEIFALEECMLERNCVGI